MRKTIISESIGNIDRKYIDEAAAYTGERRKAWIRWSVVAACLALVAVLCVPVVRELPLFSEDLPAPPVGTDSNENNVTPEPNGTGGNDSSEPVGTGGEGIFEYDRAYHWKIYTIDGNLYEYISESHDLHAWLAKEDEKNKNTKYNIASPEFTPVLIRLINEFDVPKEVFEQFNNEWIKDGVSLKDYCFTQEEIDALYSNDDARITAAFASEYAIISGNKAYAPRFYLNASDEELAAYGITPAMIAEKTDLLLSNPTLNELFSDLILQKSTVEQ